MTLEQKILTILIIVLGTMLTRFLPFLIFPAGKPTPKMSESGSRRISFKFRLEKVKALIFPPPFR